MTLATAFSRRAREPRDSSTSWTTGARRADTNGPTGITRCGIRGRAFLKTVPTEKARRGEGDAEFNLVRRGWYLGDETFRQELLAQMHEDRGRALRGRGGIDGGSDGGTNHRKGIEAEAWSEAALRDPAKVALPARLRAETTMTVGWIAERLGMDSRGYLNHLLFRQRKSGRK